jgi:LmbE family N-acetylglucosaminyl deacetylase
MIQLTLRHPATRSLHVLCAGAHSDDIEIGCGGTILRLAKEHPGTVFHWIVLSAIGTREAEARNAASALAGKGLGEVVLKSFRDGFLPYAGAEIKDIFEGLKASVTPDLILCPSKHDAHQDHRLVAELVWNTFRNQLILEYEIPKYDGDMGRPNVFVPLEAAEYQKKVSTIMTEFQSQRTKRWFEESTFLAIMRLRGMECNAASGYAEAFYSHKLTL